MSTQYKIADEIPSDVICKRLKELSDAVTKGKSAILREFDMRVPAECDRDADLVLSAACKRIKDLEKSCNQVVEPDFEAMGFCSTCGTKPCNCDQIDDEEKAG